MDPKDKCAVDLDILAEFNPFKRLDAQQTIRHMLHVQQQAIDDRPDPVAGIAPPRPNCHSDGSASHPRHLWSSLVTAGLWWPSRTTDLALHEFEYTEVDRFLLTGVKLLCRSEGLPSPPTGSKLSV